MSTLELDRQAGGSYTPAEIDRALTALAVANGNSRRAAAELAKTGLPIPRDTLKNWPRTHGVRYEEIQRQILPQLRARMAERNEELAIQYADAEQRSVEGYLKALETEEVSAKDLAGAAKNIAIAKGIATEKSLLLRGDATQITEHRGISELSKGLKRLGVVDSDAEDVTDADVVPPSPALRPSADPRTPATNAPASSS